MNCPTCGQDTSVNKSFCMHCGAVIRLGAGELQAAMAREGLEASQAAMVRLAGTWLAVAVVLLAGAFLFRRAFPASALPTFDGTPVLPVESLAPAPPPVLPPWAAPVLPVPS